MHFIAIHKFEMQLVYFRRSKLEWKGLQSNEEYFDAEVESMPL